MNDMLSAKPTRQAVAAMSDEALIREYERTGDQEFFTILYKRYTHLIFGACLKHLGNREESRDMTMSIFEKLLNKPPIEVLVFKSWLYKFIQNECFCHFRKHSNREEIFQKFEEIEKKSEIFMENEGLTHLINKESSIDEDSPNYDQTLKLEEAIHLLSAEQKTCIKLFYLNEKSYKEIATITEFTESQVKSFLQNGKRKLKIIMKGNE